MDNETEKINNIIADAVDESAVEIDVNAEAEIERVADRVMKYLKSFGFETTNTQYMRIRLIARNVLKNLVNQFKQKAEDSRKSLEPVKLLHQTGFSLYEETLHRYFADEYQVNLEDIAGVDRSGKLRNFLNSLRDR